jgi:hypothetical protein
MLFIRGARIIRQNPALHPQKCGNCCLFDVRILFQEFVSKTETDDRKTGDVCLWVILA